MKRVTLLLCMLWLALSVAAQIPPPPPPPPTPPSLPPNPPPPAHEGRSTIHFASGSWSCDDDAKVILDSAALKIKQDPDAKAVIIGYTDCLGTDKYNLDLSQKRAKAVKDYLVGRHGIDPSRMVTEGRGNADAMNDCCNNKAVCWTDRRAIIIVEFE